MMDNQAVDSEGEQFASTNLLYLNNVASFNNNSDDPVTCFVGTSKYLICGTEKGKIIRFQYNDGKLVYHDSLPLGFAISQLIPLEDCNFLLVISNKSLVYIELDSLKPLGTTGDGLFEFASLVNPTNNDPNNIQLVLATNRRAIFRCRLSITVDSVNVDVLEKIETTDTIRCVCANERGVCYATSSHYYVFNFDDTDTHHQLIGLEDRAPHIRSVAKDEFFISAPHGLNVFVSSNGSSNRQPIFAEFDVSDVCISNSILYLLGDQMISIVDIDDEDIQFELKDENLKFICKACDRFFLFTSDKKVHELKLAKEFEKMASSLLQSNYHEGLYLIESMKKLLGENESVLSSSNNALMTAASFYLESNNSDTFMHLIGRMNPVPQIEDLVATIPSAKIYFEVILPLQRAVIENEETKKNLELKSALYRVVQSNELAHKVCRQSSSIRYTAQDLCNVCKKPLESENVTLGTDGPSHTRCIRSTTLLQFGSRAN